MTWLKKYWKDLCWLALAIFVVITAVSGEGFSDYAEKPFWQNTWLILQIACIGLIVVFWASKWFSKRGK
jgi:hypothetical protein